MGIRAFSAKLYTLVICRLYLAIIANATTFRVTATMESSVLEQIMGCANAENVFAIQNGTVQVNFRECYKIIKTNLNVFQDKLKS